MVKAVNDYYIREGLETMDKIPDDRIIDLAYTTVEDGNYILEVQISFNIKKLRWEGWLGESLVYIESVTCLDDFSYQMFTVTFDDLIRPVIDYFYSEKWRYDYE